MDARVSVAFTLPFPIFVLDDLSEAVRVKGTSGWLNIRPEAIKTEDHSRFAERPTDPELDMKRGILWLSAFSRVVVRTDSIPDFDSQTGEEIDLIIKSAREVLVRFLNAVRLVTGQPWVRPTPEAMRYRVAVFGADGKRVVVKRLVQDNMHDHLLGSLPRITAGVSLCEKHWRQIREALSNYRVEALWERLLLDSAEMVNERPELSILFAAMACEAFVYKTCEDLAGRGSETARLWKWIAAKNPHARECLNKGLACLINVSLREEKPSLDREMMELFDERNAIAHRGASSTPEKADRLLQVSKDLIGWLTETSRRV